MGRKKGINQTQKTVKIDNDLLPLLQQYSIDFNEPVNKSINKLLRNMLEKYRDTILNIKIFK